MVGRGLGGWANEISGLRSGVFGSNSCHDPLSENSTPMCGLGRNVFQKHSCNPEEVLHNCRHRKSWTLCRSLGTVDGSGSPLFYMNSCKRCVEENQLWFKTGFSANPELSGCQNYGPFLDPYYNTAPNM